MTLYIITLIKIIDANMYDVSMMRTEFSGRTNEQGDY